MNKSPWILLGVLFAFSLSWWGMVYGPASQVNRISPELGDGTALKPRVGLARQGEQVYRENGCYYCHTRTATGGTFGYEIQLTQLGEDQTKTKEVIGKYAEEEVFKKAYAYKAVANAIDELKAEQAKKDEEKDEEKIKLTEASLESAKQAAKGGKLDDNLTALGISGVGFDKELAAELGLPAEMNDAQKAMVAGAKFSVTDGTPAWNEIEGKVRELKDKAGAQFKLTPVAKEWPDVQYGSASRQNVTRDFLFDSHVMTGVMRMGPDLSSVGSKYLSDANGLHAKLYDAQAGGMSSHMPTFKYLYNERPLEKNETMPKNALKIKGSSILKGHVVIPTWKAEALVAFLQSLRTDKGLPEAPLVDPGKPVMAK